MPGGSRAEEGLPRTQQVRSISPDPHRNPDPERTPSPTTREDKLPTGVCWLTTDTREVVFRTKSGANGRWKGGVRQGATGREKLEIRSQPCPLSPAHLKLSAGYQKYAGTDVFPAALSPRRVLSGAPLPQFKGRGQGPGQSSRGTHAPG